MVTTTFSSKKQPTTYTRWKIINVSDSDKKERRITANWSFAPKSKTTLTKIDGGFIDYNKLLIYIRQKDFSDNPDMTYIIDGKTYIQDMGETDGYGLIRKSPRTNRALQKKLKGIDKDNCTIEIVRGLNAYKRFGIKRVYGVLVITTK